jgi:hypothetical protein
VEAVHCWACCLLFVCCLLELPFIFVAIFT